MPYSQIGEVVKYDYGTERELAGCDLFKVVKLELNGTKKLCNEDSFVSMLILDGNLIIEYSSGEIHAQKGDSVFPPISLEKNSMAMPKFCIALYSNC